jgi:DNA polymerase III epsilon subunit family exonuclease
MREGVGKAEGKGASTRVDAVALVPDGLLVEAGDRKRTGIRITLPAGSGPPMFPLGYEQANFARWVREAKPAPMLRRYGEGWADAGVADDIVRSLEFVVVDVETTGGSAWSGHRITEVGAVRIRGDGVHLEEFTTLVNPQRPIPPFISRLTRITQSMVERAPCFRDVASEMRRILEGAVFVAHNASFDWRFLSAELEWATGQPMRGRALCTVRLARKVVPEISRRSLDALAWYFNVENVARHRAFGDARATADLLRIFLDRLDDRHVTRWGELEALLARRAPRRKRRASPEPVRDA